MIKIISFDFDGTLVTHSFADAFWLKGVPNLYAKRHHVSFEEATTFLFKEYEKIGDNRIEWYDPRLLVRPLRPQDQLEEDA